MYLTYKLFILGPRHWTAIWWEFKQLLELYAKGRHVQLCPEHSEKF